MAQYCKLAGRVTNCTDNCRICREEETKTRDIGWKERQKEEAVGMPKKIASSWFDEKD